MFAAVVLVAITCYAAICLYLKPTLAGRSIRDFSCFYRAGKMVRAGQGAKVYDFASEQQYDEMWRAELVAPGQHFMSQYFVSAPFILLIFAPLSCLTFAHAEVTWYWINAGMLLTYPFLLVGVLQRSKLLALAVLATPFFIPVEIALIEGQQSILLLLLFTVLFRELARGHEAASGCILALSTFKPQLALPMLLVLVVTRRWRAVAGFCASCFALFWTCVALVGWHTTLSFPRVLQEFNQIRGPAGIHPDIMINVRGMLYLLLHTQVSEFVLVVLTFAASVLLMIALVVTFRQPRQPISGLHFSLVVTLTLLASYHAYMHDLTLLLLPFLLVVSYLPQLPATVPRVGLIVAIGAIPFILISSPSYQQIVLRLSIALFAFAVLLFLEVVNTQHVGSPVQATAVLPGSVG
jgi:hypothetical protein